MKVGGLRLEVGGGKGKGQIEVRGWRQERKKAE
jgi:hypothetical protein